MIKLFNIIKGYVVISLRGTFPERFLNICTRRGIFLWNIKKSAENEIVASVSVADFAKLKPAVKNSYCKLHILRKCGAPFFFFRNKKRKVLFVGVAVIFVVLFAASRYIWVVSVSGNDTVPREKIELCLEEAGVKSGVAAKDIDTYSVRNYLMKNIPELSWLSINIKGTTAVVDVKERTVLPPAFDKNAPCSIVAKTDGVIETADVVMGDRLVSPGDVVKKGQILVSGVLEGKLSGTRYVHSDGNITALTWHEKHFDLPLYKEIKTNTGKKKSMHTLKIVDFCVKLYVGEKVLFENYTRENYVKHLSLGNGFVLPVSFHYDKYYEQTVSKVEMTEAEAVSYAYDILNGELSDTEIINRQYEIKGNRLFVTYTCRENIAEKVGFEFDSYQNN